MKLIRLHLPALSLALGLLAGCATPFLAPADVAHLQLVRADSTSVRIDKIWLERAAGALVVRGHVRRRRDADTTARTHLDVILRDGAGRVLRTQAAAFTPHEIPLHRHHQELAGYCVPLEPLPPGVEQIEVRAHEGEHRMD